MNVAYVGISNPLTIVVEGYNPKLVNVSTDNGMIVDNGNGKYDYTPGKQGKALIKLSVKTTSGVKEIGSKMYRIKDIPMPVAAYYPTREERKHLMQSDFILGLVARSPNKDFEMEFRVVDFNVKTFRNNVLIAENSNQGDRFNMETLRNFRLSKENDKIIFSEIHCRYPDGRIVKLDDVEMNY
jgi:hypothetical protein